MLHNPATQKQSATLECMDCDENLNLNRAFGHSTEWSFDELQNKLPKQLTISDAVERNEMKQKTTA